MGYLFDPGDLKNQRFLNSLFDAKFLPKLRVAEPVLEADPQSMPTPRTSGAPVLSWPHAPGCAGLQIRLSVAR